MGRVTLPSCRRATDTKLKYAAWGEGGKACDPRDLLYGRGALHGGTAEQHSKFHLEGLHPT